MKTPEDMNKRRASMKNEADAIGSVLSQEYVDHLKRKILELNRDERFVHDDSIPGKSLVTQITYKLKIGDEAETVLFSKDGHRGYEFIVEFDTDSQGYGIYYGCRGIIFDGDLAGEVEAYRNEWAQCLYARVCTVLNNTFIGRDFRRRFQPTDNLSDNTYWIFWIRLEPDEDIFEVAARATSIIGKVYKAYLEGDTSVENMTKRESEGERNNAYRGYGVIHSQTRFTEESYEAAVNEISRIGEKAGTDAESLEKRRECRKLMFESFISGALRENVIVEDRRYEKCYRISSMDNVAFSHLLVELCYRLAGKEASEITKDESLTMKIPWKNFIPIFVSKHGEVLDNLKKSYSDSLHNRRVSSTIGKYAWQRKEAIELLNRIFSEG